MAKQLGVQLSKTNEDNSVGGARAEALGVESKVTPDRAKHFRLHHLEIILLQ